MGNFTCLRWKLSSKIVVKFVFRKPFSKSVSDFLLKISLPLVNELAVILKNHFKSFLCWLWYEYFFCYNSVVWQKQVRLQKYCLKLFLSHRNCVSSAKLNGISDDIRRNSCERMPLMFYQQSICRISWSLKF